jgi:hypothetical protein
VKRKAQLEKAMLAVGIARGDDWENIELTRMCTSFLSNGTGGIRSIVRRLALLSPFLREFRKCVRNDETFEDHECYTIFERCLECLERYPDGDEDEDTILGCLMEYSEEKKAMNTRRDAFDEVASRAFARLCDTYHISFSPRFRESELSQVRRSYVEFDNIIPFERLCRVHILRQAVGDSTTCIDMALSSGFICGRDSDLASIVSKVKEMDFLRTRTNYQNIYRYLLDTAYIDAKQKIYEMHGVVDDDDLYRTMLDQRVDPVHYSEIAKNIAREAMSS